MKRPLLFFFSCLYLSSGLLLAFVNVVVVAAVRFSQVLMAASNVRIQDQDQPGQQLGS